MSGRWPTPDPPARAFDAKGEPRGRATIFSCEGGALYRLEKADVGVAKRLVSLGLGFESGGEDADGAWAFRRAPLRTIEALAKGERIEWRRAIAITRALCDALTTLENAGLFPGPLKPDGIALGEKDDAWILGEPLVSALLGEPHATTARSTGPSPRWTPPEQSAGASWDSAANRYVLGLCAYRMLAGAHPFGGAGVRHALDEQRREVAPLPNDVARELPPGVQSLILRMLDPSRDKRPTSAASIARTLEERSRASIEPPPAPQKQRENKPISRSSPAPLIARAQEPKKEDAKKNPSRDRRAPGLRAIAPLIVGLGIALVLLAIGRGDSNDDAARAKPALADLAPLTKTTSADCAPCHAREVAEWKRSVMSHAVTSPLFGALDSIIQEEVGRDARCPNGAGVLRKAGADACRDERSGIAITGSGGEHWCVNCHAAGENLDARMPAWSANGSSATRAPVRDLVAKETLEGISCAMCHETRGPVGAHASRNRGSYEGNATWTSFLTGATFAARPEDLAGRTGIGNSGYDLDPAIFLLGRSAKKTAGGGPLVHARPPEETKDYLQSSEFCGACHDVRLFGSDVLGARDRGENFKRLRDGYSEWRAWAQTERASGRAAPTCQDCHMSLFPGVCVKDATSRGGGGCPDGFRVEARAPGEYARAAVATTSDADRKVLSHYFTGVEIPLDPEFPDAFADERALDANGVPIGARARREMLLARTFRFELGRATRSSGSLEIPIEIENTGAGHRAPGGFTQEREVWIEMSVTDARGGLVYQVGHLQRPDDDLADKRFLRVTTSDLATDRRGRPLGVFGADVADGPDVGAWSPDPRDGGTVFRGKGLALLQNGFLRCVRCIGFIDAEGKCQAAPGAGLTRADRFADGFYDLDTGRCDSNLSNGRELFETYLPVGSLDADRGIFKAPDAILNTRSAPPGVPLRYTYVIDAGSRPAPFTVKATLHFRSFPPYMIRAFAAYEAERAREGLRPSGPQVTERALQRLDVLDLSRAEVTIE